jgi:hypothetical protein
MQRKAQLGSGRQQQKYLAHHGVSDQFATHGGLGAGWVVYVCVTSQFERLKGGWVRREL